LYLPTKPVVLRAFGPSDPGCTGTPEFTRQVSSPSFTETFGTMAPAGTWRFVLSYDGDANNFPGTSACAFPLVVTQAAAGLVPAVSNSVVTVGGSVTAGASVFGYRPTGALTVRLFGPHDPTCSTAAASQTVEVDGQGPFTVSLTPTGVGAWRVTSRYSGDSSNTPASTSCGSIVLDVVKASPTLSVTAAPGTSEDESRIGARVLLVDSYAPTGVVTFQLYGPEDRSCTGTPAHAEEVSASGGSTETATGFVVPKHAVGTWNWRASYSGDANNHTNGSVCGQAPVTVVKKIKKQT
jgi:hypothetical protein